MLKFVGSDCRFPKLVSRFIAKTPDFISIAFKFSKYIIIWILDLNVPRVAETIKFDIKFIYKYLKILKYATSEPLLNDTIKIIGNRFTTTTYLLTIKLF